MGKVYIIDSTLADGIGSRGWYFGNNVQEDFIDKISKLSVDIVELGVLKSNKMQGVNFVYSTIGEANDYVKDKSGKIKYSIVIQDVSDVSKRKLSMCMGKKITTINLLWNVQKKRECIDLCKVIKDKGYELNITIGDFNLKESSRIEEMINTINEITPNIVTFVNFEEDMSNCSLVRLISILHTRLNKNIGIGIGNNTGMSNIALVEQVEKMEKKLQHDIYIYGTVCGIGNCYANYHTENLIIEIKKETKHSFVKPVLELYDKYFHFVDPNRKIKKNLLHLCSRVSNVDIRYAIYYDKRYSSKLYGISNVLNFVSELDSCNYTINKAKKIYKNYNKLYWKNRLAIIILTANRPNVIDSWIANVAATLNERGVNLIIYDSSDDPRTENIVNKYIKCGVNNLHYERYNGNYNGVSIDEKAIMAYEKYSSEFEYIWECRDGLILNIRGVLDDLDEFFRQKRDVIVVNDFCRDYLNIGNRYYTKCEELFRDQCVQMTVLGATIVRSELIRMIIQEELLDEEKNLGMWQPISFFHYFAKHGVDAVSYVSNIFIANPNSPSSSFWTKNMLWQWAERWYDMISQLPPVYDAYKESVLKVEMSDFHPFSFKFLIKARGTGGITLNKVYRTRKVIPHVCRQKLWKFYFISVIPRSLVNYFERNTKGILYRFFRKIYVVLRFIKEDNKGKTSNSNTKNKK